MEEFQKSETDTNLFAQLVSQGGTNNQLGQNLQKLNVALHLISCTRRNSKGIKVLNALD
jgi:hypothetical protein